jgi:hypothetical protein
MSTLEGPGLHAVDLELGEGSRLGGSIELTDRSARSTVGSIRTWSSSVRAAAYEGAWTTRTEYATTPPMRATDQKKLLQQPLISVNGFGAGSNGPFSLASTGLSC